MKKKINLPNILTISRILLVPVFVVLMIMIDYWSGMKYIALGVYAIASLTDYLDGYIARRKGIVTNFGKLMDPLADKMLVAAGFIMLTGADKIPAWMTIIVVGRDFILNTLRLFGRQGGETISAGIYGKLKTAFQMIGVCLALIDPNKLFSFFSLGEKMGLFPMIINVVMSFSIAFALIFTVWSCVDYTIKYRKYIDVEN